MSTLRIYDTKGNAYSPDGTATGTNEQIKDLFYGGVRLAIRFDHKRELSLFFRARETRNARTEQFYAVYSVDDTNTPLRDLMDDLTTRIESEWGYTIDDSSDEMKVYRELRRDNTVLPGSSQERDVLSELLASRNSVTVGVSDERNAIGLLGETLGEYDQAAIADSTDADILSTFDLVITPGGHRGITPLGETEARWESTAGSLRDKHINQEIESIRDSVKTLSREYGLSNDEIRSRVQSSVPALKSPVTNSNLGSTSTKSDDDPLIPPEVGLYVAIGAAVLLILFAAITFVPLGGLGVFDTANQSGEDLTQLTVTGELVDNRTENRINSTNISVTLRTENGSSDMANQPKFDLSVNKTKSANATLVATADGYETQRMVISEEQVEMNIKLDQSASADTTLESSQITGSVTDSANGDDISSATVKLTPIGGDTVERTTGIDGTYSFENMSYGEYTIQANAAGYAESERNSISVDSPERQVDPIKLDQTGSLAVFFRKSNNNESLNGGQIRLIDRETDETRVNKSKGVSGWYNKSDLPPGKYRLELFDRPGYEDVRIDLTLEPGESYVKEKTVTCTAC